MCVRACVCVFFLCARARLSVFSLVAPPLVIRFANEIKSAFGREKHTGVFLSVGTL